jgi:peptidoglycan-associated lipoprotein
MNASTKAALVFAGSIMMWFGCGPSYPDCLNDTNCKSRNQYCVDAKCRQCRDDSHCNMADACTICNSGSCGRRANCCTTDADCPSGRCWNTPGKPYGECGVQCKSDADCPPNQRCNAQGMCEPKEVIEKVACSFKVVYFDYNEDRVRLDQQSTMNDNADCIKTKGTAVRLEGHTDERGTEEYNMALGEKRVNSTKTYLSNAGVSGGSVSGISYGEEKPTCSTSNEGCWSQNRRVEFQ